MPICLQIKFLRPPTKKIWIDATGRECICYVYVVCTQVESLRRNLVESNTELDGLRHDKKQLEKYAFNYKISL